ncbi:YpmS family protein [Lactovum odontotermitis]
MRKRKLKINRWKWLFFILLALNLATVLLAVSRIFVPREPNLPAKIVKATTNKKIGQVSTTRDELNGLINSYLEEMNSQSLGYKFYLADSNAVLQMDYKLFSATIPIYVYFQPAMTNDGSIVLTVQSISAGTLNMPASAVLDYAKIMKLPKFVKINSSAATVKIDLNQLKIDDISVKAESLDMTAGSYIFEIYKNN